MNEPSAPPPDETPSGPAVRPATLSVLLVVIVLLNLAGLARGLAGRDQLLQEIPRLTPTLYSGWIVSAVLAIVGALGLWNLRRWGFYLIGLSWAVVVWVDLTVGAASHVILATGLMWLVVLFLRPVRGRLR